MQDITRTHEAGAKQNDDLPSRTMTYQPGNVLITGGAGFIASHVAILLAEKYPDCKVSFRAT
jgi:cell wall-associated NlpC family hydrolase